MLTLDGKVAIVIGTGSAGPGWGNVKATAVLMARQGASVVAIDNRDEAVLFLASDEARHITGTGLIVDGGISAAMP